MCTEEVYSAMKIQSSIQTCLFIQKTSMYPDPVLIQIADRTARCFLFQNATLVWLVQRGTNGRSLCIGMCAKVRSAGQFFSLSATTNLFDKSATRYSTILKLRMHHFSLLLFGIFFIKINVIIFSDTILLCLILAGDHTRLLIFNRIMIILDLFLLSALFTFSKGMIYRKILFNFGNRIYCICYIKKGRVNLRFSFDTN